MRSSASTSPRFTSSASFTGSHASDSTGPAIRHVDATDGQLRQRRGDPPDATAVDELAEGVAELVRSPDDFAPGHPSFLVTKSCKILAIRDLSIRQALDEGIAR